MAAWLSRHSPSSRSVTSILQGHQQALLKEASPALFLSRAGGIVVAVTTSITHSKSMGTTNRQTSPLDPHYPPGNVTCIAAPPLDLPVNIISHVFLRHSPLSTIHSTSLFNGSLRIYYPPAKPTISEWPLPGVLLGNGISSREDLSNVVTCLFPQRKRQEIWLPSRCCAVSDGSSSMVTTFLIIIDW